MVRFERGRIAAALAAAVAVLALSACAPEPEPEPEPELLTVTEAGARYLDAICPVNEAWDEVDVQVDLMRIAANRGEDADTTPFAEAVDRLSSETEQAAKTLSDDSIAWPEDAEAVIDEVLESLDDDAEQLESVVKLSADEIAAYEWEGAQQAADAAREARALLQLPEDPRKACTDWSAQ